jgi:hypothetical protein
VNEILRFLAEGAISIVNVTAPVFPKVVHYHPAAYHVRAALEIGKAYERAKHETENESSEAPRRNNSSSERT